MGQMHMRTAPPDPSADKGVGSLAAPEARRRLLAAMPISETRLDLAGVSTAVLEGGDGPPVILLHGPSAYAAHWMGVVRGLVANHRVVVPDLPGHGESHLTSDALDARRVSAWVGELIDRTCKSPPVLVGQTLGGAIAARFACDSARRLGGLVLIDSFGLAPFQPSPEFGLALAEFLTRPTASTHRSLWRHCAFDLDGLQRRMTEHWAPFETYNLDRARAPSVQAALATLMEQIGSPAIPPADLARITVPTTLVWGRHDRATPLAVAEAASARFGWPLRVIEDCADDPPVERPEALLRVLGAVIDKEPSDEGAVS